MGILGDIFDGIFFNDKDEKWHTLVEVEKDKDDYTLAVRGGTFYDWYINSSDISNSGLINTMKDLISQGHFNLAIQLYEMYREHVLLFDESNPKNVTDAFANLLIGNVYIEINDDLESARDYITKAYSIYDSSYPFFWHCLYDMYLINNYDGRLSEARKYILSAYQYVDDSDKLRIGEKEVVAEKQMLEEFNRIDDKYTEKYLSLPYRDRKVLFITKEFSDLSQEHFTTLSIDSNLSHISFPMGHPHVNEMYIAHPLTTNKYYPIENYQLELVEERVREFCRMAQSLGAMEINIECLNSNTTNSSNGGSIHVSGDVSYERNRIGGEYRSEYNRRMMEEISRSINLHQVFQPNKAPELPKNLVWYDYEPSWQSIYSQRMEGGLIFEERIETKKSQVVDNREMKEIRGELQTLYANMNVAFDKTEEAKFEQQENAVLAISVKFAPLSQLTGNNATPVSQGSNYTENELKYIDEVKECLADGEITRTGRRLLNMHRERLGISKSRATELETSVATPQLTDDEKEYLEAYREACEDGQLSDKERRMLNRLRDMLGITEERAKEIEK